MNKKIQEFAEQCTTQYRDGNGGYIDQVDTEKFALLIVRECLSIADRKGAYDVMDDIIDHFGVEP
jgi:hypothetical protein